MIPIFQKLSNKIGKDKVIWRYDPIIFTNKYNPAYHLKAFGQIDFVAWKIPCAVEALKRNISKGNRVGIALSLFLYALVMWKIIQELRNIRIETKLENML